MKKFIIALLLCSLLITSAFATETVLLPEGNEAVSAFIAEEEARTRPTAALTDESDIAVTARAAALIDLKTGTLIYAKNENEPLPVASVTKIMTMLLTVEAIESGRISIDDFVRCSDFAASMGGSQIFLAAGETMSVRDMLKSVAVASANDASVALAEHIAGSEELFVRMMNERAKELKMENTRFYNCTGLPGQNGSNCLSASDVAIMSRALLQHDIIREFTSIWMDSIRNGSFTLANTNKLIYYYDGATGLKTGFTQEAGFCVSASAKRDESEFIAVVLGEDSSDARWKSARAMLDFAFANYCTVQISPGEAIAPVQVKLGKSEYVQGEIAEQPWLLLPKARLSELHCETELPTLVNAPVCLGDKLGALKIRLGDDIIAEIPITACTASAKLKLGDIFMNFLRILCGS